MRLKIDRVAVEAMVATLAEGPGAVGPVRADEEDGVAPAALREWLVRLRLLENVPFAYLVPDTQLLPPESIRWFYLDRRWTDALVQGALSIGTVNSDDRTQLAAQYDAIRDELDQEERNLRRAPGSTRYQGEVGPISGFVLRSAAVSGWPGLHVRAYSAEIGTNDTDPVPEEGDPRRIRLLRLERLAPAVLLCLFDGIPEVVHIEEPRQGIQFGFRARRSGGSVSARVQPRNKADFTYVDVNGDGRVDADDQVNVPFRGGASASGVVDIRRLETLLGPIPETGATDTLDSAEYALQLVQLPYRQVWGDPRETTFPTVFKPTVKYAAMRETFEGQ